MYGIDLSGKKGLVVGVANQRSIAWAIAQTLAQAGARLAFSYYGERLGPTLQKLTAGLEAPLLVQGDNTSETDNDALFAEIEQEFGQLDFLVHSMAFAPPSAFEKPFYQTTKEEWHAALDTSAYSLIALARRAQPLMREGGGIVTMTYLAAERVVPHYNVMAIAKAALEASVRYLAYDLGPQGVRVNAISAGPLRTIAARSISGFSEMYAKGGQMSMLKRNIKQEEVASLALMLLSPLGSGITGETIYVDAGYHAIGMFLESA